MCKTGLEGDASFVNGFLPEPLLVLAALYRLIPWFRQIAKKKLPPRPIFL